MDAVVAVDTTSRDDSTELLRQAFGTVVEAHGSTSFPDAVTLGLEHLGDCEWVWLLHDDSRPDPGGARGAAGGGAREPGRGHPGPQAARVALAAPAAGARDHHQRHRSPRDRPRTRRVRPGTARRRPHRARREHRRDAGAPLGARRARRFRPAAADLRQRHRLRLARGRRRPPHDRGPAGRGLPRRGGPPRGASHSHHRSAHALPGTAGGAVHAAGQRAGPVAAVPGGPPRARHPDPDDRVPAGAPGRAVARRAGGAGLALLQPA